MSVDPDSFLLHAPLEPAEVEVRYPNARRVLKGGLFISHSGQDFDKIRTQIVSPVISDRFLDGYFLHNRGSGGSESYCELVRTALYYLDKFLLVVSEHSIQNRWVRAEVAVAVRLKRPVIVCLFDDSDPRTIHPGLLAVPWFVRWRRPVYIVDFRNPLPTAQHELAWRLDQCLKRSPYERTLLVK